jgi:hypothetical protein
VLAAVAAGSARNLEFEARGGWDGRGGRRRTEPRLKINGLRV